MNPAQETARYIDSMGIDALAKSAEYTRQGELFTVLSVVVSLLVAWLFVRSGVIDRIADRLGTRRWWLTVLGTTAAFSVLSDVVKLPWTLFSDWHHERAFGLSHQSLGDFLGQLALSSLINALIFAPVMLGIYVLMRRKGKSWWLWAGGLSSIVMGLFLVVLPLLIAPLFNDFKPVPPGEVRSAVEQIADRSGISHDRIFMYDGSRQSQRFTANVSGIGPTARIAIADVALGKASLDEVKAVTAHEAGHYVLRHLVRYVLLVPVLTLLVLFALVPLYPAAARLFNSSAPIDDPRGLPVFMSLVSVLTLLILPVGNTISRGVEAEADAYSLDTAQKPDALATALVKSAEYRYPRPNALEEFVFYHHPSVEKRVRAAMEWKAAHQGAKPVGQ